MKTTNKILLLFFGLVLAFITFFVIKISSFIQIDELNSSGVIEAESVELNEFSNLLVSKGVFLKLTQGDTSQLTIEADTAFRKYLEIDNRGNKLTLNTKRNLPDEHKIIANLQVKSLSAITVKRGAKFKVNGTFKVDSLKLGVHEGGKATMDVSLEQLECDMSSGAKIDFSGDANRLICQVQSGARFNARDFSVTDAKIESSQGAYAEVKVVESLSVVAHSGGVIKYGGQPRITNMDVSTGGRLTKLD